MEGPPTGGTAPLPKAARSPKCLILHALSSQWLPVRGMLSDVRMICNLSVEHRAIIARGVECIRCARLLAPALQRGGEQRGRLLA